MATYILGCIFCVVGAGEQISRWTSYLDRYSSRFSAEVLTEDFFDDSFKGLEYRTNHEVSRDGKLWAISYMRSATTEPFKFGKFIAATDDQVAECHLFFNSPDDGVQKAQQYWEGYIVRNDASGRFISTGLWDISYCLGFWDKKSDVYALEKLSSSKDLQVTTDSYGTRISGSVNGDRFKLWFSQHPCPSRMELELSRTMSTNEPATITVLVDEIQWQEKASLPDSIRVQITQVGGGKKSQRFAKVSVKQTGGNSLDHRKFSFQHAPQNGTSIKCSDLRSQCILQDGRIVVVEPSRPDVEFSGNGKVLWAGVVSALALTVVGLFYLRKRLAQ